MSAPETLTFLFTDIEGSTAYLARAGEPGYAAVLKDSRDVLRSAVEARNGTVVDTPGDGLFAAFTSPRGCLAAALEAERQLSHRLHDDGISVRMGIHAGEAIKADAGLVGIDVHRAARVGSAAHGGQVLVSERAAALVADSLPDDANLVDLGLYRLTDFPRSQHLFQLQADGLERDFPPPRALEHEATQLGNLPEHLAPFIGRERELDAATSLVATSPLLTITGPGGGGKTRLAVELVAGLRDNAPDGVWFVDFAAISTGDRVARTICETLHLHAAPDLPPQEVLLDALEPQKALVILDNCEHVVDACAKVAQAILRHCRGIRLVATSREPLGVDGETVYRVPPLSLPPLDSLSPEALERCDSVALLLERARSRGARVVVDGESAPLLVSICRELDGLPLAIELAAARLSALSLQDLSDRLSERFGLLTGGLRTGLGRQQTLSATVAWSFDLLSEPEQLLLRRLCAFADSFDLAAAEAICGFGSLGVFGVAGLLGSLVDKSLVMPDDSPRPGRYRLLATIRQFTESHADLGDEEAGLLAARYSDYYLAVVEAAAPQVNGPHHRTYMSLLDADDANIGRAARYAAARAPGDVEWTTKVLRFGGTLIDFWMARSRGSEGLDWLMAALRTPLADEVDQAIYARALMVGGQLACGAEQPLSLELGARAVELARSVGNERLLTECLGALCAAHYFDGHPDRGLPFGEEAVARARTLGDEGLLAASLMHCLLAIDVLDRGRTESMLAEALACAERSGRWHVAYILLNNGSVHALRVGDLPRAKALLEEAERSLEAIGEEGKQELSVNLGWVFRLQGDPAEAGSRFERGFRMSRRNGDHMGVGYNTLGLACLAADRGDFERAALLHGAAEEARNRGGQPWQQPEQDYRDESFGATRAALGETAERLFRNGAALTMDELVELAFPGDRQGAWVS